MSLRVFRSAVICIVAVILSENYTLSAICPEPFSWQSVADAPIVRYEAQGIAIDGKLYLFGGFFNSGNETTVRMDVYEPQTDSWSPAADVPDPLTHAGHVADGTMIYVVGGFLGDHPGGSTDHVWIYDTINDNWSAGPSLPADRAGGALARLGRELHYAGGATRTTGQDDFVDYGDHYVLDLGPTSSPLDDANSWSTAAVMPNPRNHMGGAELHGKLYAIGGQHVGNEDDENQADVHAYDPGSDSWSSVASLPIPLGHITSSTVVWNGHIIVAGGVSHDGGGKIFVDDVMMYDPISDSWENLPPLPQERQSPVADVINDAMFVTSGRIATGLKKTTWRGFLPSLYGFYADLSGNNRVGVEDLLLLAQGWLTSAADIAPIPSGDGIANYQDFALVAKSWLLDCSSTYNLMVSVASNRSNPVELADESVAGNIYVFILPETGIIQVRFYLNDPERSGSPIHTESVAPFDFKGGSVSTADPFDTTTLTNDSHNITTEIVLDGGSEILSADFNVAN